MEQKINGKWSKKLNIPTDIDKGFKDRATNVPWDSTIIQTFAEMTNTTDLTVDYWSHLRGPVDQEEFQVVVGVYKCMTYARNWLLDCLPFLSYRPKYIWTKESLQI